MKNRPLPPPAERLILGLGVFAHDTSAAFMRNGKVLFAAEQERFDRVKHSRALPMDAVASGLQFIGAGPEDIDEIVINYHPVRLVAWYLRHVWNYLPATLRMLFEPLRLKNVWRNRAYPAALRERFGTDFRWAEWSGVDHHLSHAASAFFRSGFERSAILTSDALGEFDSVLWAKGEGTRIGILGRQRYPHSIGAIYSAVTDHLGFRIYSGEGTVMGLSGFGKPHPESDLSETVTFLSDGRFSIDERFYRYHVLPWTHEDWVGKAFLRRYGPKRAKGEPLRDGHANLAWSLQDLTEGLTIHHCRRLEAATDETRLCYAGGVALNGYTNSKILSDTRFKELFIQPAANDGGTAIGAALYRSHHVHGIPRSDLGSPTDVFLGPSFSPGRCEEALRKSGLEFTRPADPLKEVADLLAKDRVVGWFQGRMEMGPRALGHRSILANPCSPRMKDHLNLEVKHREPFRPYAPVVPEELAERFFEMPCRVSPYMLLIMKVRPEWRDRLPAITHVDGTARVQTVTEPQDPLYYRLLVEFGKRTGVPVLLNTSFNGPGEPIVCSPEDAVGSFLKWDLDELFIEGFLAKKNRRAY